MHNRILTMPLSEEETCFLWGPRQTGKSTLLKNLFPDAIYYNLLLSDEYSRLLNRPSLIREECLARDLTAENQNHPIIIDEIQKVPVLLDEVHWLIENRGLRFILCGSSARKVKRQHGNLLGGRAVRYEFFPLVYSEIENFDLEKALTFGLLPRHYDRKSPKRLLQSYVGDYLKEEIVAESLVRNIPSFSRFLEVAALCNGELINFTNIASDCGVSSVTVKEYYQILVDTLLGRYLPPFRRRAKRRVVLASKFYFFDMGVVGYLTKRNAPQRGTALFGDVFEHFILNEITCFNSYSENFYPLAFWRTSSGLEVDCIVDDGRIAIEIKTAEEIKDKHLKGIRAFKEEFSPAKSIVVSFDKNPRRTGDGIDILPWEEFLQRLWGGEF